MSVKAFPSHEAYTDPTYGDVRNRISGGGMDLRDYFAAHIVCGILADPKVNDLQRHASDLARTAYTVADAMLKVRQSTTNG